MIPLFLFFCLCLPPFPQETPEPKADEPTSMADMKEKIAKEWDDLQKKFKAEGIRVDLEKKTVEVKGVVIRDCTSRRYPIEYIIVSEGGNTHEAMFIVKATPSNLNAALLALGLKPGKTVIFRKKDPPPPKEDVESGKTSAYEVLPPKGPIVYIYVKYEKWEERPIRFLEDLILDYRTGKPMERVGWVYVGSRFAEVLQGRQRVVKYMADMERNIVATYLTGFGNAILDINSLDGIKDSLFDVNPDTSPPMHGKVTLIFALKPLK